MSKVSIRSQIAAVRAAVDGKRYPTQGQQELQREHLDAALDTLLWVEANQHRLRALQGRLPNASGGQP